MFQSKDAEDKKENVKVQDVEELEREIKALDLSQAPASTTLPANELFLLEQGGYQVLQIVYGNVVYSMGIRGVIRSITRALKRGEMPDFTRMNNDARVIARNRMLQRAQELGATLVVGVLIEVQEYADFLEVTATGTAVRKITASKQAQIAVGA